jgi:hypothetical protein
MTVNQGTPPGGQGRSGQPPSSNGHTDLSMCACRAGVVGDARCPVCKLPRRALDDVDHRILTMHRAQRAPADTT